MASFFSSDSAYSRFMNKLGDMILLSILWLVSSLPLVTMGTATCAAYYTAAKVIRRRSGYVSQEFFRSFKQNFRVSIGLNIMYLLLAVMLVFNLVYFNGGETELNFYMRCVYIAIGVMLLSVALNTYILLSRFKLGTGKLFIMAFVITFGHLPSTLLLVAACVAAALLVYLMPWAVLILPGVVFWGMTFPAERVMKKYMPKAEEGTKEADIWYYN